MRHTFLVVTVKRWLKSVYIYGSYRKIKTGIPLFLDHSVVYAFLLDEFFNISFILVSLIGCPDILAVDGWVGRFDASRVIKIRSHPS